MNLNRRVPNGLPGGVRGRKFYYFLLLDWIENMKFIVEPGFDENIITELKKRGHEIEIEPELAMFGRGQVIIRLDNGVYVAGCESRTDSNIACY